MGITNTKIASPAKPYHYVIALNGFDNVLCQSVEIQEFERTIDIHGNGDGEVKTPGRKKVPNIVIEKLVPTATGDPFFFAWFFSANTLVADAVVKDFTITELDRPFGTAGATPVRIWNVEGGFVTKFKPAKLGDLEEGNSIDTVTIACTEIKMQGATTALPTG